MSHPCRRETTAAAVQTSPETERERGGLASSTSGFPAASYSAQGASSQPNGALEDLDLVVAATETVAALSQPRMGRHGWLR